MYDLTSRIDNFALYLPAVQSWFAGYVEKGTPRAGLKVTPRDLNFLTSAAVWSYKYCLASAVLLLKSKANAITRRDPKTSWIMGDSGGYQIGTGGALRGFETSDPQEAATRWRRSSYRAEILRWLELHCDCGMTIDFPLWLKLEQFKDSPFHNCSVELLTDLTAENLRYFADNRGRYGTCEFLNVLHGRTDAEEEYWYRHVCEFDFEGWAVGGSVGASLDLRRLLRRLLLLRDEGMLGGRKQRVHVLGVSQLKWGAVLTAIQRAIQLTAGPSFTISFDTCTPFLHAAKFQRFALPPTLTNDLATWRIPLHEFPNGYRAAVLDADLPFPPGSPLSSLLTLGDMNPRKSPYASQTFDEFSRNALSNHNTYVTLCAVIEANRAAFCRGPLPPVLSDLLDFVERLFSAEGWSGQLNDPAAQTLFEAAGFTRSTQRTAPHGKA